MADQDPMQQANDMNDLIAQAAQVQVVSWYDNENSYTSQMCRTIKYLASLK